MKDEEFERLLRDAARTYNSPTDLADADATWRAIERALPAAGDAPLAAEGDGAPGRPAARRAHAHSWARPWAHPLARMAAMLLVGVAVGRMSVRGDARDTAHGQATIAAVTGAGAAADDFVAPSPEQAATDRYLVRTAALLAGLPDELRARRGDAAFVSQADALLLQTRLLLDSPAAADPAFRALLDDLEVVLAQVVRLDARRDPMEVDFLHEALEQRDVLPRLREAVADNSAD
jgi:hypothetical protein